jgi:hypothetical protein
MTRLRTLGAIAAAVALAGCGKEGVQTITGVAPSSQLLFLNLGINSPGVHFYANDQKLTATASSFGREVIGGIGYLGAGAGGFYVGVNAGDYTVSARTTDTTVAATPKGTAVASLPLSVAQGKAYTVFLSGLYDAAAKRLDGFTFEDDYPRAIDYAVAHVRVVNASHNAPALLLAATDTTAGSTARTIGSATAYRATTGFLTVPPGVYNLNVGPAGATTPTIVRTNFTFAPGRVYTLLVVGDYTVTAATAANRRQLAIYTNR